MVSLSLNGRLYGFINRAHLKKILTYHSAHSSILTSDDLEAWHDLYMSLLPTKTTVVLFSALSPSFFYLLPL